MKNGRACSAENRSASAPSPGEDVSISRRRFLRRLAVAAGLLAPSDLLHSLLGAKTLLAEAAELVNETITVDLHCHPNALSGAHFPRLDPTLPENMKAGGVDCGFLAARGDYPIIRRDPEGKRYEQREAKPGELFRRTHEQLDRMIDATKEKSLVLARSPEEIHAAKKAGLPAVVLAIEGADPLEGDLSRLQSFYDYGLRVIQLMHFRINELGDIQTAPAKHNGLTAFGREVVREMNRLGMIIDTAHGSPATLHGVLSESRQPIILSHTGPAALRKTARHLDDDTLRAIAKHNGLVGVWPSIRQRETLESFLQAIDHVKNCVGVDHVGVGTDVFGLRGATALPTHKSFPLIATGLLRRGYSAAQVEKIVGGNCMRLFHQVKETRS